MISCSLRQARPSERLPPSEGRELNSSRPATGGYRGGASKRFDGTRIASRAALEATVQILLPIAAVSCGMTIFGLVYYFDVPHTG